MNTDQNVSRLLGISADGPWMQFAQRDAGINSHLIKATVLGGISSFPNGILVPRVSDEPARFDIGVIPHPRGSGKPWPLEAIVDSNAGAGRLPVGVVLDMIERGSRYDWQFDEPKSFHVAELLAESLSHLIKAGEAMKGAVFVIPNNWNSVLQQSVIDSFARFDVDCKLLWRPIAAAIEWLHRFEQDVSIADPERYMQAGTLLSIYIGYDHLEITPLDLVVTEHPFRQHCLVPGRSRPNKHDRLLSFGYQQRLRHLYGELAKSSQPIRSDTDRYGWLWNRLWCTPLIRSLQNTPMVGMVDRRPPNAESDRLICSVSQLDPIDVHQRLIQLRRGLQNNYDGIVVTGPMASTKFDGSTMVWEWMYEVLGIEASKVLVEGVNCETGVLASGACRFGELSGENLPTYLDTLPQLEMLISEGGEPKWIELLDPADRWVDGGRAWQRGERVQNLSIAPGSTELKLAVAHEEFDSIREVLTPLPSSSPSLEKIALSVEIVPAQGNAKLELHPERPEFFGKARVYVNWRQMTEVLTEEGNLETKQSYIQGLPLIFPELLPRFQSLSKWQVARPALLNVLEMIQRNSPRLHVVKALKHARNLLREKDQTMYPRDATAFDSNGKCPGDFSLQEFMSVAWPYYLKNRPPDFVRAIAYTHIDHLEFHEHIRDEIRSRYMQEDFVIAAGKCLRSPDHIAVFFYKCLSGTNVIHMNATRLKAASELLRFRPNATQQMTSELCQDLVKLACDIFESERRRGSGKELFRLVCLVIVYTLRRRAFDDGFLDPASSLAIRIKNEFRKARIDAGEGRLRLMGGSVDLSQQLQLIIDYIDRQGKGQLLIAN